MRLNAKRIRVWMAENEVKQEALAERADINPANFSRLMNGQPVGGRVLSALRSATGLSFDDLIIHDQAPVGHQEVA